jgi:hypothetical protein
MAGQAATAIGFIRPGLALRRPAGPSFAWSATSRQVDSSHRLDQIPRDRRVCGHRIVAGPDHPVPRAVDEHIEIAAVADSVRVYASGPPGERVQATTLDGGSDHRPQLAADLDQRGRTADLC